RTIHRVPLAPSRAALSRPGYLACTGEPSEAIRRRTCISRYRHSDKEDLRSASRADPRDGASVWGVLQSTLAGSHSLSIQRRQRLRSPYRVSTTSIEAELFPSCTSPANPPKKSPRCLPRILLLGRRCEFRAPGLK